MPEDGKNIKNESNRDSGQWAYLFKIGLMLFVTFVCCILFFFLVLRFKEFADIWKKFLNAGMPIIIGLALAYIMNPIMEFIEKKSIQLLKAYIKDEKKLKKLSRIIGIIASVAILLLLLSLFIAAVVPAVITSVTSLVNTLPSNAESLVQMIHEGKFGNSQIADFISNFMTTAVDKIEDWAQNTLLPQAKTYITQITSGVISVFKGLINFVIGIIVMVYVMFIQETLIGQSKKLIFAIFRPKRGNKIIRAIHKTSSIFGGFITGKIVDSVIVGIICYIGCIILRLPNAVLVALIIGITNVIPVFGPFIGAIPCLLIVVIQSPIHALYLLIFILVLQQVDGNIIGPKILGSSTGLSSFWVMFAILIGGGMFGFLGMLLGVPIFAVIYYIVENLVNFKIRKRNLPESTEQYIDMVGVDEKTNQLQYNRKKDDIAKSSKDTKKDIKS